MDDIWQYIKPHDLATRWFRIKQMCVSFIYDTKAFHWFSRYTNVVDILVISTSYKRTRNSKHLFGFCKD